jgi:hypothetical protein
MRFALHMLCVHMALAQFWPLNKVTDGDRWKAENLFGRLGIVAHAAFLYTGFHSHGAPAATPTPWSVSSGYSLKQLINRDGWDTIVMRLSGKGRRYMTLQTYIVRNSRRYQGRRMQFHYAALAKVLPGDVDEAARSLRALGSATYWLWQLLADELCQDMFLHVYRMNGIPVAGFALLPSDIKAVILGRLDSAKDLARVECTSKEMRELVAEHDAYLWKPGKLDIVFPAGYAADQKTLRMKSLVGSEAT